MNSVGFEVKIPFDKNITVASNEMFLRATINRNLEKLLQNDLTLSKIIDSYGTGNEFSIQIYKDTRIYAKGDVIIYPEYNKDNTAILNIYLLQNTIDGNTRQPKYEVVSDYVKDFSGSGWTEINPFFSIYNSTDPNINISSFLEYAISDKFHLSHENDLEYHKFGELRNSGLSSKVLLTDFSNIADTRQENFWAYEIGKVETGNCVGTYKKWGNGVIEYDLTFCLGDIVQTEKTISEDGSIKTTNYIKVNSFIPLSTAAFNNDDYFLNEDAYRIFNKTGSSEKVIVNNTPQSNISRQVNVYSGTIKFPVPFIDENYMVFANAMTKNSSGEIQSPNTIVFSNRQKTSITAVYAIPNYNNIEDINKVLLQNNVFQCQIIGRWRDNI